MNTISEYFLIVLQTNAEDNDDNKITAGKH